MDERSRDPKCMVPSSRGEQSSEEKPLSDGTSEGSHSGHGVVVTEPEIKCLFLNATPTHQPVVSLNKPFTQKVKTK